MTQNFNVDIIVRTRSLLKSVRNKVLILGHKIKIKTGHFQRVNYFYNDWVLRYLKQKDSDGITRQNIIEMLISAKIHKIRTSSPHMTLPHFRCIVWNENTSSFHINTKKNVCTKLIAL